MKLMRSIRQSFNNLVGMATDELILSATARWRVWDRYVQALYLSPGFSDFGDGHDVFSCVGGRA